MILKAFLSMNGVEYRTADKIAAMEEARETTENEEDVYRAEMDAVDKTALEESIRRAVSVETSDCTEDTAARLEENAPGGKILISGEVRNELGPRARTVEPDTEIRLKGKNEKIRLPASRRYPGGGRAVYQVYRYALPYPADEGCRKRRHGL